MSQIFHSGHLRFRRFRSRDRDLLFWVNGVNMKTESEWSSPVTPRQDRAQTSATFNRASGGNKTKISSSDVATETARSLTTSDTPVCEGWESRLGMLHRDLVHHEVAEQLPTGRAAYSCCRRRRAIKLHENYSRIAKKILTSHSKPIIAVLTFTSTWVRLKPVLSGLHAWQSNFIWFWRCHGRLGISGFISASSSSCASSASPESKYRSHVVESQNHKISKNRSNPRKPKLIIGT